MIADDAELTGRLNRIEQRLAVLEDTLYPKPDAPHDPPPVGAMQPSAPINIAFNGMLIG